MTPTNQSDFSFDAQAFHDDLPKGKSSGTLEVTQNSIEFIGSGKRVSFPMDTIELTLGGASNRLAYFKSQAQPDWVLYTSDLNILKHPSLQTRPEISEQLSLIKNKRRSGWLITAFALMLIIAAPILLYMSMGSITGYAAEQVPAEWEETMGKTIFAQYQADIELMDQQQAEQLLPALTSPLLNAIENKPYPFKIYIVNDEAINAFALPGGYIVINSGLILKADNPEQMLGVLAHEISHVTEKHSMKNIFGVLGTYLVIDLIIGDASGLIATAAEAAPLIINQSYSRDFEREADLKGFELLEKARINPIGLQGFFAKIKAEQQKRLEKSPLEENAELIEAASSIISTHPATDERIATIGQLIAEKSDRSTPYLQLQQPFEKLQAAVANFVTSNSQAADEQ
ncbi:M48 family metallopeptidase [Pelagibaculum spongiae]|uniref:Peptidase M48 n=1 Tax=Pelagibaculum spongiae TaxID=2080658 RepID=A0A2V1H2F0_9GAMM|nr:M48 family metallopeptidase [Pelagibaculum spongiae]PVZ69467.1 peptidase M48 [Pelagibaculum spongiae]